MSPMTEQDRLEAYNAEREERWRYEQALEDRMTDTPRIGRPPKPKGERYTTPVMQLGRVPIEKQDRYRAAAKRAGVTFTAWALAILDRAEKRQK